MSSCKSGKLLEVRVGRTFQITPGESVRVLREEPEILDVEGTWGPGGEAPPKHFHPAQDERFEVIVGVLTARVADQERQLQPGDVLEIPRGVVHQMWNAAGAPTRATGQMSPAGRTGEWFEAIDALRASGRVGSNGMPGPLAFGVYLTEYADVFRLAGPQPLLRPALRVLGVLGRLKGYRPPGR
jgi:quercetin dioxygenase-like cupin family protein